MDVALKILKYAIMYIPALLGLHSFLYSKYPKYYFTFVRLFSKWRDTTWSINCDYKLNEIDGAYQRIETVLKRKYNIAHYKRPVNMKNKKLYEFGTFNMIVQDDFDTGEFSNQKLYIRIAQLNVTTNTAEEKLEELRELFNEVEREIRPENTGYNLDVYFKNNKNPFFGLMVQRLGKSNVSHFECFFPINAIVPRRSGNDRDKSFLRVYKEKLCINESSFDIMVETAKKALLFK